MQASIESLSPERKAVHVAPENSGGGKRRWYSRQQAEDKEWFCSGSYLNVIEFRGEALLRGTHTFVLLLFLFYPYAAAERIERVKNRERKRVQSAREAT